MNIDNVMIVPLDFEFVLTMIVHIHFKYFVNH